jgi:serine protease Do
MTSLVIVPVAALAMISVTHVPGSGARRPPVTHTAPPALAMGDIYSGTFRRIAREQMPTVVSLRIVTETDVPAMDILGSDPGRWLFGLPAPRLDSLLEGAGSGFIIDASGLVLTNYHVVKDARRIQVALFPDPEDTDAPAQLTATLLGRDPMTDSALLQLAGRRSLPVASLGDSDALRPGDWVMAIGNPFALSHTVTVGVISAIARPIAVEGRLQRVIQTDAAVNPGNSGGPLLNLRGQVVGMTSALLHGATGGNVGVGFAVPINLVRDLLDDLRRGDVRHARLGLQVRTVPAAARSVLGLGATGGVLIVTVEPGGPADRSGVRPGDVLLELNGVPQRSPEQFLETVLRLSPGTKVPVAVMRGRARREMTVTPDELQISPAAEHPDHLTADEASDAW